MNKKFQTISKKIVQWYAENGRHNLPWRKQVTPYKIWISEIMLQQTQVKTVIPFFKNFLNRFPNQKKLSMANEDEILAQWSGLGFYRRARNIFATKEIIKNKYNNIFPKDFNQIIDLPGIGKSTAGAIMSLAYSIPHPILDGNVKRVITRLIKQDLDSLKESELWSLSENLVNQNNCFAYTQGIMDLGATICTPKKPKCNQCPLNKNCLSAFNEMPLIKKKSATPKQVIPMNFSLIQTKQSVLLTKNEVGSIWKNLWLPFESEKLENNVKKFQLSSTYEIQHELTHRRLKLKFNIYSSSKESQINTNQQYKWIKKDKINAYGLPKPISTMINEL